MPELFIISKNPHLVDILTSEGYACTWYNDSLMAINATAVQGSIILFDSSTYGIEFAFLSNFFNQNTIILGHYEEQVFVRALINHYMRGYLLVNDFITELPKAISVILNGGLYITHQLEMPKYTSSKHSILF